MVNVWQPEHPHHAVWKEYTKSLLDGKPKAVEYRTDHDDWLAVDCPEWVPENEYRIARPMVERTVRYPEPLRVKPEMGVEYFSVEPSEEGFTTLFWADDEIDNAIFNAGMAFATEADAAEAHKALFGGGV